MPRGPARLVVHGMVAPTVPFPSDSIEHIRVSFYVFTHTEKGGLVSFFCQHIEDARGPLRVGAIVECQVYVIHPRLPCPPEFRKQRRDSRRDTGCVHGCNFSHKSHT